jgi:hypothetical protein
MPAAGAGNVNVEMAVANLDAIRERRSEILDRASQHGARNVRVFGSAARGDAGPASDVDLLVEMEPGRSLLDFVGLWQELEDLLGVKARSGQRARDQPIPARTDPVRSHRFVNSQRAYLLHTLDAIDAVMEYTQDGRDAFFADRKTQDAVIRNIEVLGQAVKGLSAEPGTR